MIGGGPAGLAAAAVAARHALHTVLVDERPSLGGQIYRQPGPGFVVNDPGKLGHDFARGLDLVRSAGEAGAELSTGTTVVSLRGTAVVMFGPGPEATATTVHARASWWRRGPRPAGRLSRLDAPRGSDCRRRPGFGESVAWCRVTGSHLPAAAHWRWRSRLNCAITA